MPACHLYKEAHIEMDMSKLFIYVDVQGTDWNHKISTVVRKLMPVEHTTEYTNALNTSSTNNKVLSVMSDEKQDVIIGQAPTWFRSRALNSGVQKKKEVTEIGTWKSSSQETPFQWRKKRDSYLKRGRWEIVVRKIQYSLWTKISKTVFSICPRYMNVLNLQIWRLKCGWVYCGPLSYLNNMHYMWCMWPYFT